MESDDKWWQRQLSWIFYILIGLFGGIGLVLIIYLSFRTAPFMKDFLSLTSLGQIGDFIGGFLGTILTGITLVLLVQSNVIQVRENDRLRNEADFQNSKTFIKENVCDHFDRLSKEDFVQIVETTGNFVLFLEDLVAEDLEQLKNKLKVYIDISRIGRFRIFLRQFDKIKVTLNAALLDKKFSKSQKALLDLMIHSNVRVETFVSLLHSANINAESAIYFFEEKGQGVDQAKATFNAIDELLSSFLASRVSK